MGQPNQEKIETTRFPYHCKFKNMDISFIPSMVDYENSLVWKKNSKEEDGIVTDDGTWISFDELIFHENDGFINPAFPNTSATETEKS